MDTDFMNTALLENKLNPKCWWKEPVRNSVTDPVCLNELKALIDRLEAGEALTKDEWVRLIDGRSPELAAYLFPKARAIRERVYGTDVYVRGLIEYSNYCKNNCLYCGIRAGNQNASRYRLSTGDILSCCQSGYSLGFRTFVLQGGEDPFMTEDKITELVSMIRREFPDCAITLSLGEMEYKSYKRFFDAGADRYLLRHETANAEHYQKLHPTEMSFEHRMNCLTGRDPGADLPYCIQQDMESLFSQTTGSSQFPSCRFRSLHPRPGSRDRSCSVPGGFF